MKNTEVVWHLKDKDVPDDVYDAFKSGNLQYADSNGVLWKIFEEGECKVFSGQTWGTLSQRYIDNQRNTVKYIAVAPAVDAPWTDGGAQEYDNWITMIGRSLSYKWMSYKRTNGSSINSRVKFASENKERTLYFSLFS